MQKFPKRFPVLETERLILRSIHKNDAEDIFVIYSDQDLMRYTGEAPFPNVATVDIMLASVQRLLDEQCALEWVMHLKDGDRVIGTCGLHSFDEPHSAAEVGCLLRRSAWGFGYMRESILDLIQYAANSLGLHLLRADVHPENKRAAALFSALGFAPVAGGLLERRINNDQRNLAGKAPSARS